MLSDLQQYDGHGNPRPMAAEIVAEGWLAPALCGKAVVSSWEHLLTGLAAAYPGGQLQWQDGPIFPRVQLSSS